MMIDTTLNGLVWRYRQVPTREAVAVCGFRNHFETYFQLYNA